MSELVRYSFIKTKFPREFLLLQGKGCFYKKCRFCDYYNDISENPFEVNKPVIEKVSGETGALDIINSGSCLELDDDTMKLIYKTASEKNINTIWFETHYLYKNKLPDFRKKFPSIKLKFRTGVESFNSKIRQFLNKGIPQAVTAYDIAKDFDGVCLLIGFVGQTRDDIIKDINMARKYFEYTSVNVFVENSTDIKRDENLIAWFNENLYPKIKNEPSMEILLNNTDLGVG